MDKVKELADFMDAFIDASEPDVKETTQIEKEYESLFGHSVPREMLPSGISENQLISALKKCDETQTDTLFENLGVQANYDYLY